MHCGSKQAGARETRRRWKGGETGLKGGEVGKKELCLEGLSSYSIRQGSSASGVVDTGQREFGVAE